MIIAKKYAISINKAMFYGHFHDRKLSYLVDDPE